MSPSTADVLRHILDELESLARASSGLDRDRFLASDEASARRAAGGDALGRRAMAGMRDRLIHAYFAVDYELVWDVIAREVPRLRREMRELIERQG